MSETLSPLKSTGKLLFSWTVQGKTTSKDFFILVYVAAVNID